MPIGTGISAQVGMKAESTYGTPVVVDRFFEFESEGIDVDIAKIDAPLLGGGRFLRNDRVKTFLRGAGGPINFGPVMNKNFGLIFQHMLGQNTVTGASANKTHTCIPDANALQGKSMTLQVGRPDFGGTVRPYTFEGGKILDWELTAAIDEALKLNTTWDFENVLTATALASASYVATQEMFIFTEGALTIGGASTSVKKLSVKGNNALATDRRFIGPGGTKKEPLAKDIASIMANLECEHENLDVYAAWLAGTQAQLVATFTSPTVIPTTAVPFSVTVTIPKFEYTGETPKVGGPDIVMQPRAGRALYDGTNPPITIVYVTTDTVP